MVRHHKTKMNIPMCLAAILLCLTLFSCHLCGGLYAKYSATGYGEDAARVAKFDVSEDGAYFSENIIIDEVAPGSEEREIIVTNNSEVAVACVVTIKNKTQNIPYSFSIDGSTLSMHECSVTCNLEPNSKDNKIEIVIEWEEEGALKYMGMVDLIELTISAEHVD